MSTHTPLDPKQLSTAAQRALGPGPGRTMAARGMMPLPPLDQLVVLYQLALDGDANIAQSAKVTAAGLPEKLLAGTLSDPAIDPRVLDYFGGFAGEKPTVFDAIVLNPSTGDETVAGLAARAGARETDLIAQNEQRLLRHPEIIAAMYMNRRARMSTIDRVVELAVRNNVRVPGLAAWDEVARALTGDSGMTGVTDDAVFDAVLGVRDDSALTAGDAEEPLDDEDTGELSTKLLELQIMRQGLPTVRVPLRRTRMMIGSADGSDARIGDGNVPAQWLVVELDDTRATVTVVATRERAQIPLNRDATLDGARIQLIPIPFRDLPIPAKIRAATLGDAFIRNEAIRDPLRLVAMAAIKSPGVSEIEAARYAGNQTLSEDVIRYIAGKREWTKMYGVKVSLCRNPKAPYAETTRLIPFLRPKDVDRLIKSKGVPSAVVAMARKLKMQRGGRS
jgi:hypothetical protein